MKRLLPIWTRAAGAEHQPVGAVLGAEHPLARVIATQASVGRQSIAVGAAFAGSLIARSEGDAWATAMTLSAAIVLLGLGAVAITLGRRKRKRALDLILEGREYLPVAAVQRQRRRLVARRTRRRLARTFEAVIKEGSISPMLPGGNGRPLFDVAMLASVEGDLRALISELRMTAATARGVARAERILTDECSPLHGHDPEAFRNELRRVRRLLSA